MRAVTDCRHRNVGNEDQARDPFGRIGQCRCSEGLKAKRCVLGLLIGFNNSTGKAVKPLRGVFGCAKLHKASIVVIFRGDLALAC